MKDALRGLTFILLRIFPLVLILAMIGGFTYYSFHVPFMLDDFAFRTAMDEKGILENVSFFYKTFNGRFSSHFFLCTVIDIFNRHESLLFIYRFTMLFLFVISLAHLIKNYLRVFRNKTIDLFQSYFWSAFITSFLFFFYFAGRIELWFWISSTGVYLISLIIGMTAFSLLLSEKSSKWKLILVAILFFLIGGLSESYAIMYLIILLFLALKHIRNNAFIKKNKFNFRLVLTFLILGLILNLISVGSHNRLNQLQEFAFPYAFKNTLHSLAFVFLRYKYFLLELGLTLTLILFSQFHYPKNFQGWKHFFYTSFIVFIFIFISFLMPCYILSDIVPDRAAAFGYFAGVLFLFDYFIFRSNLILVNKKRLLH